MVAIQIGNDGYSSHRHPNSLSPMTKIQLTVLGGVVLLLSLSHYLLGNKSNLPTSAQLAQLSDPVVLKKNIINPKLKTNSKTLAAPTIAYAWTLAKCVISDDTSTNEGMLDAALVLKHSIHKIHSKSDRYPNFQMYVLVHPEAVECSKGLQEAGYTVQIVSNPIGNATLIRGDGYLRNEIDREGCCGSEEFIKLHAYTLFDHPIVVHVDVDFLFFQPMDEMFDLMLLSAEEEDKKKQLLTKITTQHPLDVIPQSVEAFWTRDYQQIIPGDTKPLIQAGFMVVKPNQQVFDELVDIILQGDFQEGWNETSGWQGLGYGGKVGDKTMQGLLAYYYDIKRPNVSIEVHGCYYNWMGGDVLYRGVPKFYPQQYPHLVGKCRDGSPDNGHAKCMDCQKMIPKEIKSAHFTNCRKPWNCIGTVWEKGQSDEMDMGIDERNTNVEVCLKVVAKWHQLRSEMEQLLLMNSKQPSNNNNHTAGQYKKEIFGGHCSKNGQAGYLPLSRGVDDFRIFQSIYQP